jgi:serine/threonine-protein kinase
MSYLSPEAARGEEVDNRADIFAVGILLYELLTGKRLFYGETDYQTVELVRNAKIPPIKPQNPQVEPELEDVVRKALAKRKEDRFQNATDIQDALAQYSYSRGLKVISRDISELVRQCLDERRAQSGEGKPKGASIIDHLLQDEIVKFTSVDFEDPGALPLTPDELSPRADAPHPAGDAGGGGFIDPRAWAQERLTPAMGLEQLDRQLEEAARATVRDDGEIAAQAAEARKTGRSQRALPVVDSSSFDALGGPTPGPESLAAVLEPTGPKVVGPAPARRGAGRSFLIGVAIGVVILGAAVAAMVAKKSSGANAAPHHSSVSGAPLSRPL